VGRGRLIALAAAALLAGCGPTPPQAPGPQAYRLNKALSAISSACGHATEIQALSNDRQALTVTEHQAERQIPVVARVHRQNPGWIFQGKTVAELVEMSATYLDECGLHEAARRMRAVKSAR
jgi:hypothetical protein